MDTVSSGVQDVVASAGFWAPCAVSPAQATPLSATVAVMGALSGSPTPLPKRAPHRRASEPAHGSHENCLARCWEAVSGLASKCCPPLPVIPFALSGSSTAAPFQPVVLVVMALCFEPATSPSPSSPALFFYRRSLRHCLARVLSGVASPARQQWLGLRSLAHLRPQAPLPRRPGHPVHVTITQGTAHMDMAE